MESSDVTDRDLVGQYLKARGERPFRRLYRRHSPALYALTLRLLGGREPDAQDVLQETWLRACRALPRFRWECALRTWLSGIAINCVREHRRRGVPDDAELDETRGIDAGAPPEGRFDRLDWERAIAALPDGCRHVLVLFDIEGYTHDEVGRLLEISSGTSKSQLSRARRRVRLRLQSEGDIR